MCTPRLAFFFVFFIIFYVLFAHFFVHVSYLFECVLFSFRIVFDFFRTFFVLLLQKYQKTRFRNSQSEPFAEPLGEPCANFFYS